MKKTIRLIATTLFFVSTIHGQNLLTNGGFEQSSGSFGNGAFTTPGWSGSYNAYNSAGFSTGSASEGTKKFDMATAATIATAIASQVTVTPGYLYKFSFDLQTYRSTMPSEYLGTYGYLYFYNSSNALIKTEFTQSLQDDAVYPWQTITLYAVAPAGAIKAGVKIQADRGSWPNEDIRNVYLDNCTLEYIPEDLDRIAIRFAPQSVEAGKSYSLTIRYAALAASNLTVKLMNGTTAYGETVTAVSKGRGMATITYSVPANAPDASTYVWDVRLPGKTVTATGVVINATQLGSQNIAADNANIAYMGRIDRTDPLSPIVYWFGSQINTRFGGTSIAIKATVTGHEEINYVIDENESDIKNITLSGTNATTTLATGLTAGTHTIRIMKATESTTSYFVFKGFTLDAGKGLLKPDLYTDHKIEIYGNSVTSGGSASPAFKGYAPTLARALHSDVSIISKGGTGIAASWSGLVTLSDFWDKLDFTNAFSTSGCKTWNFASWQADIVFVGIGHNDQFNGGPATFTANYRTFLTNLETKYPNAHIFCSVPLISNPYGMLAAAIKPVQSQHPRVHLRMQLFTDASVTKHPSTVAHQAMIYGDETRWSTAEWIEETMGFGLGLPENQPTDVVSDKNKLQHAGSNQLTNGIDDSRTQIFSTDGRQVSTKQYKARSGIYVVKIINAVGKQEVVKMIK